MKVFGEICFIILSIVITSLLGGFVFAKLWQWFIVYAFTVNPVSVMQAIGIVFFWDFLNHKIKNRESISWEKYTQKVISEIVYYALALGIGYFITLFQ